MEKNEYKNIYKFEDNHWWYKGLHELVELYIIKEKIDKKIKIFDAGCGTGKMISILQNYGDVKGNDFSRDAIDICRERGLDNVEIKDLNTWSSNGELYDIIVCLDVLYHSSIDDDIEIIRKFYSALNNEGVLILNNPAFNLLRRKHDVVVGGKRRYRKNYLISELDKIGFKKIISTYRLPYLFIVILIKKAFRLFFHILKNESDLKEVHPFINRFLLTFNRVENFFILKGLSIPFGSSLFIIAQKT